MPWAWSPGPGVQAFPLHGRTLADVESWLGKRFLDHGLKLDPFRRPLHFEIPGAPVGSGAAFDASDTEAWTDLAHWFANGDAVMRAIAAGHPRASEVRCWPHHFDTGAILDESPSGEEHSVGIGLSPGDELDPEPYFYINADPTPETLPALPLPLEWHTREWTGIVVHAAAITCIPTAEQQAVLVHDAIATGVRIALEFVRGA